MAERPTRRPAASAAQAQLKQLEARLARLEDQLTALRSEASGSAGAARARLEGLERRAAAQIGRAQATLRQSLESITRALSGGRLTRAVRAGVRAGSQAYRRRKRR